MRYNTDLQSLSKETASAMQTSLRYIQPDDNTAVSTLVKSILEEHGCIGPGYASSDKELEDMYTAYQGPLSRYWVVVDTNSDMICGGGGFAPLKGTAPEDAICELQKLYLYPQARGLGLGRKIIELSLHEAKTLGFQEMYLETVPAMAQAMGLYEKLGFQHLEIHKGNTGHANRCSIYMSKIL